MHYFPAGLAFHGAVREHEAVGHEPPHPLLGASVEKMLHGKAVGHEPPHPLLGALTKKQSAVSAMRTEERILFYTTLYTAHIKEPQVMSAWLFDLF